MRAAPSAPNTGVTKLWELVLELRLVERTAQVAGDELDLELLGSPEFGRDPHMAGQTFG